MYLTSLCTYVADVVNFPFHNNGMSSWLTLSLLLFHVISTWSLTWKKFHNEANDQVSAFPTTLNCYLVNIKIQEKSTIIVIIMFKIFYKTHWCAGMLACHQLHTICSMSLLFDTTLFCWFVAGNFMQCHLRGVHISHHRASRWLTLGWSVGQSLQ